MNATLTPTKEVFQNYAQLRAKHAWEAANEWKMKWEEEKKRKEKAKYNYDVASKKLPHMIIENGLLGAIAFALEKKGEDTEAGKLYDIFCAILGHLKSSEISIATASSVEIWLTNLADTDVEQLRVTSTECMAYLSYLRRFAQV